MSSKSKSSPSEGSNNKATSSPATPRVSKLGSRVGVFTSNADFLSPLQKPRLSLDHSPRSVTSRPIKPTTTPDKQSIRVVKGTELQAQLTAVQIDLKKAKEKLAFSEKEKAKALEEAKEAKRLVEEANEQLREALAAQKRAEEDSEIESFRALEIEQFTMDTDQTYSEKWKKDLESIRHQHALDLSALLSTTEDLQRVKQELLITTDTKNQALIHADEVTRIAETHAERTEILSAELAQVKASMESRLDKVTNEKNELISQLVKIEIYEEKLVEKEDCIEQLNVELEAAKITESYNRNLAEEWIKKSDALEIGLEAISKKLEESNCLLRGSESEISSLHEKIELLEKSVYRQRDEIEKSEHRLEMAKGEAADMAKKVEFLASELEVVKKQNIQALNNEKIAADSFRKLLEEKNKLAKELENLSDENEKNKEAMESLTVSLYDMSTEVRETEEKLLSSQEVNKNYELEIENLNFTLRSTSEKYNEEITILNKSIELSKDEYRFLKEEWEKKEFNFMTLLKEEEEKALAMDEERASIVNKLTEAQSEILKLKENFLSRDNEIHGLIHENEELHTSESDYLKKIEELSKLLEESIAKTKNDENSEISDSEKDNISDEEVQGETPKFGYLNWKNEDKKENDVIQVNSGMWEGSKIEENEFSIERSLEIESFEEEDDPKVHENGETSPLEQQSEKKKKPLLKKFGSLLKKKGGH